MSNEKNQNGSAHVHLAIELQVLARYPGLFSEEELYSVENLRGIPAHLDENLHLTQIRYHWDAFYAANPRPTREQVIEHALRLDGTFGNRFDPPLW